MTGYPIHPDAVLDRIDLLKCELDHLRTRNADLMKALEAVFADITDEHSQAWIDPAIRQRIRGIIAAAKGEPL